MHDRARIIVAPNGARKQKSDHPAVPITLDEVVATAVACHAAGADGIHAHVRDAEGGHVLDAGLYRELLAELARQAPTLQAQITTEAVGRYSPAEQRAVVRAVEPRAFSAALKELLPAGEDFADTTALYHWAREAGTEVQHILYAPEEIARFAALQADGVIPDVERHQLLFVLGRYAKGLESDPADLQPFLDQLAESGLAERCEWMVCAFGRGETAALRAALERGGNARVGFENSLWQADGSLARDNAERVAAVVRIAVALGQR